MRTIMMALLAVGLLGAPEAKAQVAANAGVNVQTDNDWRYKWHNNQWWYYNPQNQWMVHHNNAWVGPSRGGVYLDSNGVPLFGGGARYSTGYRGSYYGNGYNNGYYNNGYYGNGYYQNGYYGNGYYNGWGSRGGNIGAGVGGALGGQRGANVGGIIGNLIDD
jgi:hypothetical protein